MLINRRQALIGSVGAAAGFAFIPHSAKCRR